MQRHAYQPCLLCLGRLNAKTLANASTDNFHKLPDAACQDTSTNNVCSVWVVQMPRH